MHECVVNFIKNKSLLYLCSSKLNPWQILVPLKTRFRFLNHFYWFRYIWYFVAQLEVCSCVCDWKKKLCDYILSGDNRNVWTPLGAKSKTIIPLTSCLCQFGNHMFPPSFASSKYSLIHHLRPTNTRLFTKESITCFALTFSMIFISAYKWKACREKYEEIHWNRD